MRLNELNVGQTAVIVKILGHGAFRKRLIEMGFVKGKEISAVLSAPLRDPVKYSLMGYEVSLRHSEARMVEVATVSDNSLRHRDSGASSIMTTSEPVSNDVYARASRTINVALIGNPNCGKTSLFNIASGAREHVGNYSGVTVEAKTGTFTHGGYKFNIVDLPGTYSLSSYSPEELYVRRYLRDETPDVIVNVVVASNLERNLYLTTELIDMDRSMVIALNMYDELKNSGQTLDYELLGSMIGVPMVPTVSKTGEGIDRLFDTIIRVYEGRDEHVRHVHVNLGDDIENVLRGIIDIIKTDRSISQQFSPRYLAIKFMEQDREAEQLLSHSAVYEKL
ncbi:MAG: 50S ribosome-binding GTPase, partial [Muribaculaceae bacterium]|nr:50S ribosome-binding GTPase [Muribaculaceae bacterium]